MGRLAEIQNLVSEIASAVGLDSSALFSGEMEALGKRLHDVQESLTVLADVAESREKCKLEVKDQLNGTKDYLQSVQKVCDKVPGLTGLFLTDFF